jgi:CRISPR-associated endoribonuclease Cas6
MPHALRLRLALDAAPGLSRDCTMALHRQVFEWLRSSDPELARAVHDKGHVAGVDVGMGDGRFPVFTASPARPDGGEDYFVTALPDGDAVFARLCRGIAAYPAVELDGVPIPLAEEPEVAAVRSYADLHAHAESADEIQLRFVTPTFFTSDGRTVYPPDPVRVFKGYAERWNAFAPVALRMPDPAVFARWVERQVSVQAAQLQRTTRTLRKGTRHVRYDGVVGEVRYAVGGDSDGERMWMARLADYAEFCGTGRMAAQGFGQTYRLGEE